MTDYQIVDIHTHMFNADDLPVRGFVKHVVGAEHGKAKRYAKFLDENLQKWAPDYEEDLGRLQRLLSRGLQDDSVVISETDRADGKYLNDVADIAAKLALAVESDPILAEELAALFPDDRRGFGWGDIARAAKWAALFAQSRVDLPGRYARSERRQVRLATPMLVDLECGVEDSPVTTIDQQIELFDLVSQASIRRVLPGARDLLLLPFVAFDPRRHLNSPDPVPSQQIRNAILHGGFVGVKLYPPMGWAPRGNERWNPDQGEQLDEIVLKFARWCVEKDVPVTAHCNDSQYANPKFKEHGGIAAPARWRDLLSEEGVKRLRVNLGHLGGAHDGSSEYGWTEQIAQLMTDFDNVYADVGCHDLSTNAVRDLQFTVLAGLAQQHTRLVKRTMFGTDWYMQAIQEDHDKFLEIYRDGWREGIGEDSLPDFMGGNALRFLGFTDPTNANTIRVRARFEELGKTPPEWLLAR